MGDFLKELGKHFLNFALALIISLVFQPLVQGKFNPKFTLWVSLGYTSLLALSLVLFTLGDKLEKRDQKEE